MPFEKCILDPEGLEEAFVLNQEGGLSRVNLETNDTNIVDDFGGETMFLCGAKDSIVAVNDQAQVWKFTKSQGEMLPWNCHRDEEIIDVCVSWDGQHFGILFSDTVEILKMNDGGHVSLAKLSVQAPVEEDAILGLSAYNNIVVLDIDSRSVYVFQADGQYMYEPWGQEHLENPTQLLMDVNDQVIIHDESRGAVMVFTLSGELIHSIHRDIQGIKLYGRGYLSLTRNSGLVFLQEKANTDLTCLWLRNSDNDDNEEDDVYTEEEEEEEEEEKEEKYSNDAKTDYAQEQKVHFIETFELETYGVVFKVHKMRRLQNLDEDLRVYGRVRAFCDGDPTKEGWQTTESSQNGPSVHWDEVFQLHVLQREGSTIRVEVWGQDSLQDRFVCGTVVPVDKKSFEPFTEKWFVCYGSDGSESAEIQLSCSRPKKILSSGAARQQFEGKEADAEEWIEQSEGKAELVERKGREQREEEDLESTIESLIFAVRHHSTLRRLEALERLAASSRLLHEKICLGLGRGGFRSLTYLLDSNKSHVRKASANLLGTLIRSNVAQQRKLVRALDWPGVYVQSLSFFCFFVPGSLRQLFMTRCVDEEDLTEENYVDFVEELISHKIERELPGEHNDVVEVDIGVGGGYVAYGFFLAEPGEFVDCISRNQSCMSWAQGMQVLKLHHRFDLLAKQSESVIMTNGIRTLPVRTLIQDPICTSYVNFESLPERALSWDQLRNYYWFQAYQIKESGTLHNLVQKIELHSTVLGIQGRSVTMTWKNKRAKQAFDSLEVVVEDRVSGQQFHVETSVGVGKDAMLFSAQELEQMARRIRFSPQDLAQLKDQSQYGPPHTSTQQEEEDAEDDDTLWLVKREPKTKTTDEDDNNGKSNKTLKVCPEEDLVKEMANVAHLWNKGDKPQAGTFLLTKATALVPCISHEYREIKIKLLRALKLLRLKHDDRNITRVWKLCDKYLRERKKEKKANQAKKPTIKAAASLKLNERLVEMNRKSLQVQHETVRQKKEADLEDQLAKHKARKREKERTRHRLLQERAESRRQAEEEIRRNREQTAKEHAEFLRTKAKLAEVEAKVRLEKKREEQKRLVDARKRHNQEHRDRVNKVEKDLASKPRCRFCQRVYGLDNHEVEAQSSILSSESSGSIPEQLVFDHSSEKSDRKKTVTTCCQASRQENDPFLWLDDSANLMEKVDWENLVDFADSPRGTHGAEIIEQMRLERSRLSMERRKARKQLSKFH